MRVETNIFISTNLLKILTFLAQNAEKEFIGSDIRKATGISRAGVYLSLRRLKKQELVNTQHKGRLTIYSLAVTNPVIKQFKVLTTVLLLNKLIFKLKPVANRIILFGSSARGEDYSDSDIDLFVLAKDTSAVKEVFVSYKSKRKLQPLIQTPVGFIDFKDKEKVYYNEIATGITLWENIE
jgi:predicted nucleotidyltransferase